MIDSRINITVSKKEILTVVSILTIALFLRIFLAFSCKIIPDAGDQGFLNRFALHFMSGKGLFSFGALRTPAYPIFLGLCYKLFGQNNYLSVFIMQGVLSTFTVLFIYLLGKEIFSRKTAVVAMIAASLYLDFILYSISFATETLVIFLIVLAIYFLYKRKIMISSLGAGFFFGLASLARPPASFFLPGAIFAILADRVINLKSRVKKIALFLIFYLLAISPWIVGNLIVEHKFVMLAEYNGGFTFYSANNPDANGGFLPPQTLKLKQGYSLEDNFWIEGWQFIKNEPMLYMRLLLLKLSRFFSANNDAYMSKYYLFPTEEINKVRYADYTYMQKGIFPPNIEVLSTAQIRIKNIILGTSYIFNALIFIFFLVAIFSFSSHHRSQKFLLYPAVSYSLFFIFLFLILNRYRLPYMPFFILYAAEGFNLSKYMILGDKNRYSIWTKKRACIFFILLAALIVNFIYSFHFYFSYDNVYEYWGN